MFVKALAWVAGQYGGRLVDGSDRIRAVDLLTGIIADFQPRNDWYTLTKGQGLSLVLLDQRIDPSLLDLASSWRPSDRIDGSPGRPD